MLHMCMAEWGDEGRLGGLAHGGAGMGIGVLGIH